MATYSRVTPATQANFAAVINDPLDSEDANKLAQVDLQTRQFVSDYLATIVDSTTEKIKPGAIDPATSLASLVNGSTSNTGTEQQIVQGTVSTPDLRNLAVTTAKLADDAVTAAKIADGNVGTSELAALAVTAAKIDNATITDVQLASNAVTTAKITDLNVTTAKIADNAVTSGKMGDGSVGADQLLTGSAEGQLLLTGANPYKFAVKPMSGDATIDKDGVVSVVSRGLVEVEEQASLNTAGGAAAATTWNVRGVTRAWVKTFDTLTSSFLTISSEKLQIGAGTYLIEASAPSFATTRHQLRVNRYNAANASQQICFGTSEAAPATVQSRSHVRCLMTFIAGDYIKLEHYTVAAESGDGLGLACNATPSGPEVIIEVYAQVKIQKLSS